MTDYTKLVEALRYCEFGWSARTCDNCEYSKTDCQLLLSDAAAAIEELQEQLPKQGEWELIDGAEPMRWGCSRCKYLSWETSNYCPNCGAKMTEVQDGENES